MGNNADGKDDDAPIIPLAAPLPPKNNSVIPVAIAAFVGALAGAVVGSQLG